MFDTFHFLTPVKLTRGHKSKDLFVVHVSPGIFVILGHLFSKAQPIIFYLCSARQHLLIILHVFYTHAHAYKLR